MSKEPTLYGRPIVPEIDFLDYDFNDNYELNIEPISTVFDQDYKLKEMDLATMLQQGLEANSNPLTTPVGKVSLDTLTRYNDPLIDYNPNYDMEELYARTHPFTWSKALESSKHLYLNSVMKSFGSFAQGMKGAAEGDVSKLWNNEYTTDVANVFKSLDHLYPQYKTRDENDNPFALRNIDSTLKSIFPAMATAATAMTEMIITELAFITAGAVAGDGVGAVPGAMVGAAKNIMNIPKWFKNIRNVSSAISTGAHITRGGKNLFQAKQITTYGRRLATGYLAANGEAGLQAKLNGDDFYKKQVNAYFNKHGHAPTGKVLDGIIESAQKLEKVTYSANLPILLAGNVYQIGNLMRGTLLAGKPTLIKEGLKLTQKGLGKKIAKKYAWETLAESLSEGGQELSQGIIDHSTQDYYDIFNEDKSAMDSVFKSAAHSLTSNEGILEFAAGALMGGGMNVVGSGFYGKAYGEYKKAKTLANEYNSSTNNLYNSLRFNMAYNKMAMTKFQEGDSNKALDYVDSSIFNQSKFDFKNGTHEATLESMEELLTMSNEEFNKEMKMNFSPEEQQNTINRTINQYKKALETNKYVAEWGRVNPYSEKSFFKSLANKINPDNTEKAAGYLWSNILDLYAQGIFKADLATLRVEALVEKMQSSENSESLANLTQGLTILESVAKLQSSLKDQVRAELFTPSQVEALQEIFKLKDGATKYMKFIDFLKLNTEDKSLLNEHWIAQEGLNLYTDNIKEFNTSAGLRRKAEEISDLLQYIELNRLNKVGDTLNIDTEANGATSIEANSVQAPPIPADSPRNEDLPPPLPVNTPTPAIPPIPNTTGAGNTTPLGLPTTVASPGNVPQPTTVRSRVKRAVDAMLKELDNVSKSKGSQERLEALKTLRFVLETMVSDETLPSEVTKQFATFVDETTVLIGNILNGAKDVAPVVVVNTDGTEVIVEPEPIKLAKDFTNEPVIYKGKKYILKKENSGWVIENDTTIRELYGDDTSTLEGLGLELLETELSVGRYNIRNLTENTVTINNIDYSLVTNSNGSVTGLRPVNKQSQIITNENMLIALAIQRNKTNFTETIVIEEKAMEDLNEYIEEDITLLLIRGVYENNWNDTVSEALDKLYSGETLTAQEELSLELWVRDAIVSLTNMNLRTPNDKYRGAIENLETINILLYDKDHEKYKRKVEQDDSSRTPKKRVKESKKDSKQTKLDLKVKEEKVAKAEESLESLEGILKETQEILDGQRKEDSSEDSALQDALTDLLKEEDSTQEGLSEIEAAEGKIFSMQVTVGSPGNTEKARVYFKTFIPGVEEMSVYTKEGKKYTINTTVKDTPRKWNAKEVSANRVKLNTVVLQKLGISKQIVDKVVDNKTNLDIFVEERNLTGSQIEGISKLLDSAIIKINCD